MNVVILNELIYPTRRLSCGSMSGDFWIGTHLKHPSALLLTNNMFFRELGCECLSHTGTLISLGFEYIVTPVSTWGLVCGIYPVQPSRCYNIRFMFALVSTSDKICSQLKTSMEHSLRLSGGGISFLSDTRRQNHAVRLLVIITPVAKNITQGLIYHVLLRGVEPQVLYPDE